VSSQQAKVKTESISLFFTLLRSSLWNRPFEASISEETLLEIIEVAKEQSVQALIADALIRNNVRITNKKAIGQLMSYVGKTEEKNRSINRELVSLTKFLRQHGARFVVVKGQTLGSFYRNPLLRVSGDIDFYVVNDDCKASVIRSLEKMVKMDKTNEFLHDTFRLRDTEFELHHRLAAFSVRHHQRFFDQLVDNDILGAATWVQIDGEDVPTLSPTLNAAYTFIHIYHHFLKEGIGIRQFCDWAMLLHKKRDDIDRDRLKQTLSGLGYLKAYRAFGTILIDEIGLSREEFPFDLSEKDFRWKEKIMDVIFTGGNFGKYGRSTEQAGWAHSLETGLRSANHVFRFFSLSPRENLSLLPTLVRRSITKNLFR